MNDYEIERLRIVLFLTPGCAPAIVRELSAAAAVRRVDKDSEAALALRNGAQLLVTDKDCWMRVTSVARHYFRERRKSGQAKIVVLADRGIKSTLKYVHDIDLVLAFDEPPKALTEALYKLMSTSKLETQTPASGRTPVSPRGSRARRVLIIDDSLLNNRIVTAVLSQAGYQVTCLTNAFEMRTWVQEHLPDLVLVDYSMPALRGDQLIEINRRTGLTVPMVLYTNATPAAMAAVAEKCGAIGYILKGVSGRVLLEQLERVFASLRQPSGPPSRDPG